MRKLNFVLTIVAFVIFNTALIPVSSLRHDFSYGGAYTLSPSTKKILKNLNDIVTIKFFASSDLPTRILPLKNDVVDLLNEYQKENKARITIKVLDPKKDQGAMTEVQQLGIPQLQFSQLEQNKYAVSASYFGIALSFGDKKEILPQVTDIESLEYNLTASIYKLTRKEQVKISIAGRTEGLDPSTDDLATFTSIMKKQFDLSFIDLSTAIDPIYKMVLIFDDNKKEYSQEEIEKIKAYIDQGGNVAFFVDGVWVQNTLSAILAKHNLFSVLSSYGITLNQDLILSANAELVNFGSGQISFLSPYPFWVKTNVLNPKSSYFSNVQQLTFPWVSSVSGGNELVRTTKKSWEQKDSFTLTPQTIPEPKVNELKQFVIGSEAKTKNGGAIVVIPSSRFVLEKFLTRTSDNLEFVLNIVNDYASGGALTGIRQRAVSFYPLPDISDNMKDIVKYSNILILPLLFGLYGFLRLMKRR